MTRVLAAVLVLVACASPAGSVDPTRSSVTVDRTSGAIADGLDAVTISVTVRDGGGTPLGGHMITVTAPDDVSIGAVRPTDENGTTSITLTSVVVGPKLIGLAIDDAQLEPLMIEFVPGPVAGLVFVEQPATGELGSELPEFQVGFADAFDNVVINATGMITVSLQPNGAAAYLGGVGSLATVAGVATFSAVHVDRVATGLVLRAESATTPARDSAPFDVVYGEPASASALIVSPSTLQADGLSAADVVVTLRNSSGVAIPGYAVAVTASGAGKAFYPDASGQTDAQGQLEATLTSTAAGSSTVTATAGDLVLDASVVFVQPTCVPQLPGGTSTIVGPPPSSMVVADFNADGHKDAAVLHRTTETDQVSILRGAGNGRFHAPVQYPIAADVGRMTAGDLDGDGDIDLVFTGGYDRTLWILLNQGVGQFVAGTAVALPYTVLDVEVLDFNNDLKPDLVARGDYIVMTAAGNGNATFQAASEYVLDAPQYSASTASIEVARLDGNSTFDIFTVANGYYTVLLGNANGSFTAQPSVNGVSETDSVAVADYDGDTNLDIISGLTLMRGLGNGAFASPTNLGEAFAWGKAARAADVDGDGKYDLVASVSMPGVNGVRILRGNGNGTFALTQNIALGRGAVSLAVADFNEDGEEDILVLQGGILSSINLLRGTGSGTVIGGARFFGDSVGSGRAFFWPVTGDFDGNGTLDFVAKNDVSEETGIQLAAPDGTLTAMATQFLSVSDVATGDFDTDGKLDVLVLGSGLSWLRGNGDGTLQAPLVSAMPSGWAVSLRIADLDAGAVDDVAFVNPIENKVTVAFGTGAGAWTGAAQYPVATEPMAVEVSDLDGDGDRDLVVASRNGKAVTVLTNNAGVFSAGAALASAGKPSVIAIGDVDSDGAPDIIVGDQELSTIGFFKGTGTGGFAAELRINVGVITPRIQLRDLDGDGELDLLSSAAGLYVFRGAVGATFLPPLLYDIGFLAGPLLSDFDADGKLDLMSGQGDYMEPGFTIAYNKGCQ